MGILTLRNRGRIAALGSALLFVLGGWVWLGDRARYGSEIAIATLLYLPLASPLHRRASAAIARKKIGVPVFLSIGASVAYWISLAVAIAWLWAPRWFPLRWLDDTLSPPVYFWVSAALLALGLLWLSRSKEEKPGD